MTPLVVQRIVEGIENLGHKLLLPNEVHGLDLTDPSARMDEQRAAGRVIAVSHEQQWWYPSFQFESGGGVRHEYLELLQVMRDPDGGPQINGWSLLSWLTTPIAALQDFSPVEALQHQHLRPLVATAAEERFFGRMP